MVVVSVRTPAAAVADVGAANASAEMSYHWRVS